MLVVEKGKMMTVAEVADRLNLTVGRIRVLCREGRFAGAQKIGRDWGIPASALETYTPQPPGRQTRAQKRKMELQKLLDLNSHT